MKELFQLIKNRELKKVFIEPTINGAIQFFRYIFVGGISTMVDWSIIYIFTSVIGIYHLISAIISFIAGLVTNFVLSKLFVFSANEARVNKCAEFIGYSLIGLIGLGITESIMFLFTDQIGFYYMTSKIIATLFVLAWNYIARKKIIYK